MRILANPVVLRSMAVLFCAVLAFLMGLLFMRLLRKKIVSEAQIGSDQTTLQSMPLHVYNTVIQQLRQQQQELQSQSQSELQRLRASETFFQAMLTGLPCGVLLFGPNGLVKASNPAAKQILGFASAVGMGAEDIFRGALAKTASDADVVGIADEVRSALKQARAARKLESEYESPDGQTKLVSITISSLRAEGAILGAACVIEVVAALSMPLESSEKAIEHAAAR